jgi:hypothetical protein
VDHGGFDKDRLSHAHARGHEPLLRRSYHPEVNANVNAHYRWSIPAEPICAWVQRGAKIEKRGRKIKWLVWLNEVVEFKNANETPLR